MKVFSGRVLHWHLLHEGFPGLGVGAGDFTIRPSILWRGLYTVRHSDGYQVGSYGGLEVAKIAAHRHHDLLLDHAKAQELRNELQATGSC